MVTGFFLGLITHWFQSQSYDNENVNLPLISPLHFSTLLLYTKEKNAEILLQGNTKQTYFSSIDGEDETPDYAIINMNLDYKFNLHKSKINTKFGVENMLDTYYSTYSDWNNFPRQGRNFF